MEDSESLLEEFTVDLLVFLATITNIVVICCIVFRQTKLNSGYLLLLHLAGKTISGGKYLNQGGKGWTTKPWTL